MITLQRIWLSIALAASVAAIGFAVNGDDGKDPVTFSFTYENDLFSGTDKDYSSGTKLSWDYAEAPNRSGMIKLPLWAKSVAHATPGTRSDPDSHGATLSLGQSIFTPRDTQTTQLLTDDRPYAGWTYLSLALRESKGRSLDTLELTVGVVGPDSFAEDVQNWVHRQVGSHEARGWENQLGNEIGGILAWRRDVELLPLNGKSDGWGVEIKTTCGAVLGNIYTHVLVGANIRFGHNLGLSGSSAHIRPGSTDYFPSLRADPRLSGRRTGPGFFLALGAEGRYVARNIFVEGNTWADSHGKEREDWVGDYYAGLTLVRSKWALSYIHTHRSQEFIGQVGPHEFGSLTLSRRF